MGARTRRPDGALPACAQGTVCRTVRCSDRAVERGGARRDVLAFQNPLLHPSSRCTGSAARSLQLHRRSAAAQILGIGTLTRRSSDRGDHVMRGDCRSRGCRTREPVARYTGSSLRIRCQ